MERRATKMGFRDYKLPDAVRDIICKKAGAPFNSTVVLHDQGEAVFCKKYIGKPKIIDGRSGYQPVVACYLPWLRSKGDLVRMLWQSEMEFQSFQRGRLDETPPQIVDATARIATAELLLGLFPKHHARFQQLLDDATELEATARLLEAAYGRPERRTTLDHRSFS